MSGWWVKYSSGRNGQVTTIKIIDNPLATIGTHTVLSFKINYLLLVLSNHLRDLVVANHFLL